MSRTNFNESVILAVTRNGDDITVRIDKNGLGHSQFEGPPIVDLQLKACHDPARVLDESSNSIDQPIEYEIVKEGDEFTIFLWIHYSPDEMEIHCAQVIEAASDYTIEDWKRKTNRLARLYQSRTKTNELSDYTYFLLKSALSNMIKRELDLYRRKIDFIRKTNAEQAAILTGEIQAYRKVLQLIGLGELDGQPVTPQIREWLSRIWDDNIENQVAYAKSVERRIADMGKAALFSLLEMLKDSDPRYRREASLILGLIDPVVQEKVLEILQLDGPD